MRILVLADVFYPDTTGGAGRVAYHLSLELSEKGHEVHAVSRSTHWGLSTLQRLTSNLFLHHFFSPSSNISSMILSETKNSYQRVKKLTLKTHFDLVCVHQSLVTIASMLMGSLKNIPIVYYFHSPRHEEYMSKGRQKGGKTGQWVKMVALLMKWIEKRILLRASRIIVLSHPMRDKVLAIHRLAQERIATIPGGIDLTSFCLPEGGKTAAKKKAKLPTDKAVFLTVRNLVPRMGIENLIEAFKTI